MDMDGKILVEMLITLGDSEATDLIAILRARADMEVDVVPLYNYILMRVSAPPLGF